MTKRRFVFPLAVVLLATAGAFVACKTQVPAPMLPGPVAPEVTPVGPKPPPIDPKRDAERAAKRKKQPPRVADLTGAANPRDAGVDDVIDLPPVVDATVAIVRDAAQPLN